MCTCCGTIPQPTDWHLRLDQSCIGYVFDEPVLPHGSFFLCLGSN
jgi:hypothetical protein